MKTSVCVSTLVVLAVLSASAQASLRLNTVNPFLTARLVNNEGGLRSEKVTPYVDLGREQVEFILAGSNSMGVLLTNPGPVDGNPVRLGAKAGLACGPKMPPAPEPSLHLAGLGALGLLGMFFFKHR